MSVKFVILKIVIRLKLKILKTFHLKVKHFNKKADNFSIFIVEKKQNFIEEKINLQNVSFHGAKKVGNIHKEHLIASSKT